MYPIFSCDLDTYGNPTQVATAESQERSEVLDRDNKITRRASVIPLNKTYQQTNNVAIDVNSFRLIGNTGSRVCGLSLKSGNNF